jgi:hypothetical protein
MTSTKQPELKSDRYVLQDSRDTADGKALFWREGHQGYTTKLSEAHQFTMNEALQQHQNRLTDIPHDLEDLEGMGNEVEPYHLVTNNYLLVSRAQTLENGQNTVFMAAHSSTPGATPTENANMASVYHKAQALALSQFDDDLVPLRKMDVTKHMNVDNRLPLSRASDLTPALLPPSLVDREQEVQVQRPPKNTRIDLTYTSESLKAHAVAILPGEIEQETLDQITELLIDGHQIIAEQVGLPTPLEECLNDPENEGMMPDDSDHVLTNLDAWSEDKPSVEDLLTDEPANSRLSPRGLATCLTFVDWDYGAEMDRLDIPAGDDELLSMS